MKSKLIFFLLFFLFIPIKQAISGEFFDHRSNIKNIEKNMEFLNIDKITPLGNSGNYRLHIGDELYLTDKNAQYLIPIGKIFEVFGKTINEPTEKKTRERAFLLINTIDKKYLVNYEPNDSTHRLYVLMDYTCPFCQRFHSEITKRLNQNNISVHYIPFNRNNAELVNKNNLSVFCLTDNDIKKNQYNTLITTKEVNVKTCETEEYFKFIDVLSENLNPEKISPVAITDSGIIIKGLRDISDYLDIIKSGE